MFNIFKSVLLPFSSKKAVLKEGEKPVFSLKDCISNCSSFTKENIDEFSQFLKEARHKIKDIPKANYELGERHLYRSDILDALLRFKMVCFLQPQNVQARSKLARCYFLVDEQDNSIKQCEKILQDHPDHEIAKYITQKIKEPKAVKKIPVEFINDNLDLIARSYEGEFIDDSYKGHKILISLLLEQIQSSDPKLSVLDLGCGVGLCGAELEKRGAANKIVGVDGSIVMLNELKKFSNSKKKIYDRLVKSEISLFLSKNSDKYDVIIFDYCIAFCGDLSTLFKNAKKSLNSGGYVVFAYPANNIKKDYRFDSGGDFFEHSLDYIKASFESEGFEQKGYKSFELAMDDREIFLVYKGS